jgi:hypothetical protein
MGETSFRGWWSGSRCKDKALNSNPSAGGKKPKPKFNQFLLIQQHQVKITP